MTMDLIPIKEYVEARKAALTDRIKRLAQIPKLTIIQVGNNEASNRYVRNKVKDCEEVGIQAKVIKLDYIAQQETQNALEKAVKDAEENKEAVIVQLPLPPGMREPEVMCDFDVDGFGSKSKFQSATPKGIMDYLAACGFEFEGANVVILGRSNIVGKPLAKYMTDKGATVTLCHSKTKNFWTFIESADLVVSAVGKPNFLNCWSIHIPVIDVGINFNENGKMVGDCFNTEDRQVTPVPGGVGLLTRLALLENVVSCAERLEVENG